MVTISNIIGVISITLLIYWVFAYSLVEVFQLKVFKRNITETFDYSIMGILALMSGALMINIMFNLTRIAEKHNDDVLANSKKRSKALLISIILSFPLIACLLFVGDSLTTIKREKILVKSASEKVQLYKSEFEEILDYDFSAEWIMNTSKMLDYMSFDETLSIIVPDKINGNTIYLRFSPRTYFGSKFEPEKTDYTFDISLEEQKYLNNVFENDYDKYLFSSYHGKYKLFFPYKKDNKTIVLWFRSRLEYGKIGS
jgi:hypothetical protein